MNITINFTDPEANAKLDKILTMVGQLITQEATMDADVQALITEVTNLKTVDASAEALINGIAAQITAAIAAAGSLSAADRSALQGAVADITSNDSALAAAVKANTPAAPTATPAA